MKIQDDGMARIGTISPIEESAQVWNRRPESYDKRQHRRPATAGTA